MVLKNNDMTNDITSLQQVLELLKAGVDPTTCNLVLRKEGLDTWNVAPLPSDAAMAGFPSKSFEDQVSYIHKTNIAPAWTTCALLGCIPDSSKLTVTLTRGGYDTSEHHETYEDAYMSDAYFAIFEYEDDERDFYIERTFGGDSYLEAAASMVIAYLTELKAQIG